MPIASPMQAVNSTWANGEKMPRTTKVAPSSSAPPSASAAPK